MGKIDFELRVVCSSCQAEILPKLIGGVLQVPPCVCCCMTLPGDFVLFPFEAELGYTFLPAIVTGRTGELVHLTDGTHDFPLVASDVVRLNYRRGDRVTVHDSQYEAPEKAVRVVGVFGGMVQVQVEGRKGSLPFRPEQLRYLGQ